MRTQQSDITNVYWTIWRKNGKPYGAFILLFGEFVKYTEGKSMVSDTVNCGICVVGKLLENV